MHWGNETSKLFIWPKKYFSNWSYFFPLILLFFRHDCATPFSSGKLATAPVAAQSGIFCSGKPRYETRTTGIFWYTFRDWGTQCSFLIQMTRKLNAFTNYSITAYSAWSLACQVNVVFTQYTPQHYITYRQSSIPSMSVMYQLKSPNCI